MAETPAAWSAAAASSALRARVHSATRPSRSARAASLPASDPRAGGVGRGAWGIRRVGMVPEPGDAREGRVERAVGGGLAERPAAAEALGGDVDDVGTDAADVLVVEAPLADHVAAVVLDQDVRRRAETERQLAAARRAQVEGDAQPGARGGVEGPRAVEGRGLTPPGGVWGGVAGPRGGPPGAGPPARAPPASAPAAPTRTTSPFRRRKSAPPQCPPSGAWGWPGSPTTARHCRGEPGSTRT